PPSVPCNRTARRSPTTQATKLQDADSWLLVSPSSYAGSASADYGQMRYQRGKTSAKKRKTYGVDKNLTGIREEAEADSLLTHPPLDNATDHPIRCSRCCPGRSQRLESFSNLRVGLPRLPRRVPGSPGL